MQPELESQVTYCSSLTRLALTQFLGLTRDSQTRGKVSPGSGWMVPCSSWLADVEL